MDEQKEPTQDKPAETTPNPDVGKPTDAEEEIVTKAKEAAESQKEAETLKAVNLEKEEKLLERKEALAKLGGGSLAGDRPAVAEETPAEYSKKVMENGL